MSPDTPARTREVVLVSYAYPPSSSPGAVRVTRLLARLPALGWRCSVVTVGQAVALRSSGAADPLAGDPSRLLRVDDPLAVVAGKAAVSRAPGERSLLRRMAEHLIFPDRTILWALKLRKARPWARKIAPQIVHSTSPALSAHIAAMGIARATGAKWVAEFRDPASWLAREDKTPAMKRWLLARLEALIVARADATVVVSEAFAEYFRSRYPGRPIHSIPNGAEFDAKVLEAAKQSRRDRQASAASRPFVLVHAGELYGGARNPAPLIAAAKRAQALTERPIVLRFIGADSAIAGSAAQTLDATHLVDVVGPMSHAQSVQEMSNADAVVALLHDDPLGRIGIMSKFFDYAATANPVLVVGERVAMLSRIVEENGMGRACEYADIDGMATWIADLARQPHIFDYDCVDVCRRWSADAMAASLAKLFDVLVPGGGAPPGHAA